MTILINFSKKITGNLKYIFPLLWQEEGEKETV